MGVEGKKIAKTKKDERQNSNLPPVRKSKMAARRLSLFPFARLAPTATLSSVAPVKQAKPPLVTPAPAAKKARSPLMANAAQGSAKGGKGKSSPPAADTLILEDRFDTLLGWKKRRGDNPELELAARTGNCKRSWKTCRWCGASRGGEDGVAIKRRGEK